MLTADDLVEYNRLERAKRDAAQRLINLHEEVEGRRLMDHEQLRRADRDAERTAAEFYDFKRAAEKR